MKVALVMLLVAVTAVYHTEGLWQIQDGKVEWVQEDRWNVALASDQCGASGLCANLAWFKKNGSSHTFANEQECRDHHFCQLADKWARQEAMNKAKQQG